MQNPVHASVIYLQKGLCTVDADKSNMDTYSLQ